MKFISTAIAAFLLTFSVAEAKKSVAKKNTSRKPASASVQAFCGVLARGTSGHDRVDRYTIVDQTNRPGSTHFNVAIPLDAEISDLYAPRPGDSQPGSDTYRDHNFRIAGENVWLEYAGNLFTDSAINHGKCVCVTGIRSADTNSLNYIEGYALRNGKCAGISQEVVTSFGGHQP